MSEIIFSSSSLVCFFSDADTSDESGWTGFGIGPPTTSISSKVELMSQHWTPKSTLDAVAVSSSSCFLRAGNVSEDLQWLFLVEGTPRRLLARRSIREATAIGDSSNSKTHETESLFSTTPSTLDETSVSAWDGDVTGDLMSLSVRDRFRHFSVLPFL